MIAFATTTQKCKWSAPELEGECFGGVDSTRRAFSSDEPKPKVDAVSVMHCEEMAWLPVGNWIVHFQLSVPWKIHGGQWQFVSGGLRSESLHSRPTCPKGCTHSLFPFDVYIHPPLLVWCGFCLILSYGVALTPRYWLKTLFRDELLPLCWLRRTQTCSCSPTSSRASCSPTSSHRPKMHGANCHLCVFRRCGWLFVSECGRAVTQSWGAAAL